MLKSVMSNVPKATLLIAVLFSSSACSQIMVRQVTVSAGKIDRHATPVCLEVSLSSRFQDGSARAIANGRPEPAQIERLGAGKARIWWIWRVF